MSEKDKLGDRMKGYENEVRYHLENKKPVIIRLDGKAFHTFTRKFQKPFDSVLIETMQNTMQYLCENIQNCVFGYTQSDEITLVLLDDRNPDTSAWFDNNIQKITSVSASMATFAFNKFFAKEVEHFRYNAWCDENGVLNKEEFDQLDIYEHAISKGAFFDSRCFNVPKEEVINCLIWRQLDAQRNSKQMVGQYFFSPKELHGKSCEDIVQALDSLKGVKWDDLPAYKRHGSACVKKRVLINKGLPDEAIRSRWFVDINMPSLVEDREYLNNSLNYIFEEIEE